MEVIQNNKQKKEIDRLYHAPDIIDVPAPAPAKASIDIVANYDSIEANQKKTKPLVEERKDGSTFVDLKA